MSDERLEDCRRYVWGDNLSDGEIGEVYVRDLLAEVDRLREERKELVAWVRRATEVLQTYELVGETFLSGRALLDRIGATEGGEGA